jgi:serine/threonine-protein kinase
LAIFGDKLLGGKYRIESVLGEGGMGLVVEATNVHLGQRVAIKLLNSSAAESDEAVKRFEREAQIAAQLQGDHITHVTDFGETDDGRHYLVMELLEGHDLAEELLVRGRLPIDEAVDYVLQACTGVVEAHAAGLVHRDLKPANLFLTRRTDGRPLVKVLDFGLSKQRSRPGELRLTQAQSKLGTVEYMSPEQIRSAKDVDARSDQHALGLILFELLTGRRAYRAATPGALTIVIATQAPPHPRELRPDIPEDLDTAVVRALAKDRRDRFPDVVEFARAIAPSGPAGAWATAGSIASTLASAEPFSAPMSSDGEAPSSQNLGDQDVTKLLRKDRRPVPRFMALPAAGRPQPVPTANPNREVVVPAPKRLEPILARDRHASPVGAMTVLSAETAFPAIDRRIVHAIAAASLVVAAVTTYLVLARGERPASSDPQPGVSAASSRATEPTPPAPDTPPATRPSASPNEGPRPGQPDPGGARKKPQPSAPPPAPATSGKTSTLDGVEDVFGPH